MPITVTARSKSSTVIARINTEIVGSNPIRGMDVCMCIYVYVALCIPIQWVLPVDKIEKGIKAQQKGCRAINNDYNNNILYMFWFL
jgi:hypothetical protein